MRGILRCTLVAALAAAGCGGDEPDRAAAPAGGPAPDSVLAVLWSPSGGTLARLDPRTLARLPGPSLSVGPQAWPWAYSPDRRLIALGSCERDERAQVRIVRLADLAPEGEPFDLGAGCPAALAWPEPRRLILARYTFPAARVSIADPHTGRLLRFAPLEGQLRRSEAAPAGLVLLLGPRRGIGASRLALVDAEGAITSVPLAQTLSGWAAARGDVMRQRDPALALAPDGGRAYVVGAGEPVAEVALPSLRVRYHELSRPISLLGRLRNWLEPVAEAKGPVSGPTRIAALAADGRLVISGRDEHGSMEDGEFRQTSKPAGVQLVDTRSWSVRTLADDATGAAAAGNTILAFGAVNEVNGSRNTTEGAGLTAYDTRGRRRFHAFGSEPIWDLQIAWPYAYVGPAEDRVLRVLDLRSGRVVTERRVDWWPQLLVGRASR